MRILEFGRLNGFLSLSGRLLGAGLICAAVAFAADPTDVQQADGENARQLIRQSDKFLRRGNLPEAERVLRRALVLSPDNSLAKLKLAFVNIKQRRLLDAYNLSFEVAQAEPDNAYAFAVLGTT